MTNSFNPSLGVDTSKTNYLQTEVDMTEATNKQIDRNVKMMDTHFNSLIKMHNDSIKANQQGWKELAQFTKEGMKFAKWARDKADAKAAINNYYDEDAYQHQIKRDDKLDQDEAELDEQKKINYTAAGEIEAIDPDIADALKETGIDKARQIELLGISHDHHGEFKEKAKDFVLAEVSPGVYKTWNEPGGLTALERSIISKEIDEVFITQIINASGYSRRLINKYLIKPMMKDHEALLVKARAESIEAQKAQKTEFRRQEFVEKFNHLAKSSNDPAAAGSIIENYLKDFAGYHAASSNMSDKGFYLAKQELQGFILDAIANNEIDPNTAKGAINYLLSPNDGGPKRSIEEYLPAFVAPIKKAIALANSDKLKEAQLALKMEQKTFVDQYINKWRETGELPSEEEIQKAHQEYRIKFGENSSTLSNYWSKQDIADADIEMELNERWSKTGEIFIEDLDGISDAEIKAKWLQRVNEGGLSSKEITKRDATIKTIVNDRTLERDANRDKSFKWDTIYNNALERYDEVYRSERSQGQNHRTAKSVALKETKAYIQTDAAEMRNWEPRDDTKADNINSARAAIIKDNSVIDSPDLWKGEEAELKAALRYINTGKGGLPQYYKSFPFINLTPYELMQRRLAATGMIKPSEVKPIPERELQPETQDLLLNKPSPSRTIRALNSGEDMTSSLESTSYEDVESLVADARIRAERNNQVAGWEIALVNIDPTLEEEHTQVVGEQSPFMRLNTMLPGVATAYVEDTYNV